MATTHADLFEKSVRESHEWIDEVTAETGLDRERALDVLRAVLHAIRDEVTVRQSGRLTAEMPALIRGLYFEGWEPNRARPAEHELARFLTRVRASLPEADETLDIPAIARGVLRVVDRHLPDAHFRLRDALPRQMRALWPESNAQRTEERHARLELEERVATYEALRQQSGHERGAPMAPHQNRTPGEQHRGGPLPNTMG